MGHLTVAGIMVNPLLLFQLNDRPISCEGSLYGEDGQIGVDLFADHVLDRHQGSGERAGA